jgi:cystathionine beta-lyase
MYNFDKLVDRDHTANVKYDLREKYFGKKDVLPMWVADMDFETPPFIREAVQKRASHPIYGYSFRTDAYFQSMIGWFERRFKWSIEKDWILFSPGVVPAFNFALQAFTKPGDKIIVQPPVYFPFFSAIKNNNRIQLDNRLIYKNNQYFIDFDDLRQKAREASMIFFCSPHNPSGRCWSKEELTELANICMENDVFILSDEIHADLILPGHKHIPTASLSDEIAQKTITCVAPSKTFNIAGLATSSVIIKDEALREKFNDAIEKVHVAGGNLFGAIALEAGYSKGDQWLDELMIYIQDNYHFLREAIASDFPQLKIVPLEATYLCWIDFTQTGFSDEEIRDRLINKAALGLSHGPIFGQGGEGFQRMNIAAPRQLIKEAFNRLHNFFD